jgi:antitoxin (DNA-binding transcriptional repressor) of toxin-antitoxin stability system
MKTITLRTLVREPLKVKRLTRAGQSVQVTDSGEPLWILHPASGTDAGEAERRRALDEVLDEVLREKPSKISAARLLEESRR